MRESTRPPLQVLVVEDELPIRQLLRTTLCAEGYVVHEAGTAGDGEAIARHRPIDFYLIDLGLPDDDGVALIRRLRTWTRRPIIVLSARSQEHEKVVALDAGADDFLPKPFGVAELHARLRVARRNSSQFRPDGRMVLKLGAVVVDLHAKTISRAGEGLRLTAVQWRLLEALGRHAGSVVTSGQLLREVWGPGHAEQGHYLRIYVRRLRQSLEDDPSHPRFLVTETGIGYRLLVDPEDERSPAAGPSP